MRENNHSRSSRQGRTPQSKQPKSKATPRNAYPPYVPPGQYPPPPYQPPPQYGNQPPPFYSQPTEAFQQPPSYQPGQFQQSPAYPPYNQQPAYPPGSYPPSGYGGPPQPPFYPPAPPQPPPHRYHGWMLIALILAYIAAMVFLFLEIVVTSSTQASADTSSTAGSGILASAAVILFLALHGFIMVLDGRSFFSLFGRIRWNQMKGGLKVLLVFGYLSVFIMPFIYLLYAVQNFLRTNRQTLGESIQSGWQGYRAKSSKAQIGLALLCLFLIGSFVAFTSLGAMADRASALRLLTPTVLPGVTSTPAVVAAATSVPTTDTSTPTPTLQPTPTPTPKPTPKPTPTQVVVKPTPTTAPSCQAVNGNPWCYNFNPGNLIYYPPSGFCGYFNCIPSFYEKDDPGDGYIIECSDGTYSQSGGERGACSYHGGESRPLYSH